MTLDMGKKLASDYHVQFLESSAKQNEVHKFEFAVSLLVGGGGGGGGGGGICPCLLAEGLGPSVNKHFFFGRV